MHRRGEHAISALAELFSVSRQRKAVIIFQYCLTGKHIPEAVLTMQKAGSSSLEYLRVTLQEIIITRVHPVYYNTMRVPRETVSLAFSRAVMDYILQNTGGGTAGTVASDYDMKTNTVI